jgi:hypothetical protein
MTWYICETNEHLGEVAYYGPFQEHELTERLNDSFADFMAEGGADLEPAELSVEEAQAIFINPRDFWMSQTRTLEFIEGDECLAST